MQKYKNIHKTALALFRHSPFCAYSPPKRPPSFYAFPAPRKTALPVGKFPSRKEYFASILQIALPRRKPLRRFGYLPSAKNASPPFYVRSAVFLTPSIKPAPPFYAFPASRITSLSVGKFPTRKEYFAAVLRPFSRFSHSVAKPHSDFFLTPSPIPAAVLRILRHLKELPKKEKRRGISATDTPLSPTPRSLQCDLYPTRLDSTRISPQSQRLFTNKIPPRQNPHFIDAIRHPRRRRFACHYRRSAHFRSFRSHSFRHPLFPVQLPLCFRSRRRHFARRSAHLRL